MTDQPKFEIRHNEFSNLGATIWMDELGHLHVRMSVDNVTDVIFEDARALRPRHILCRDGKRVV